MSAYIADLATKPSELTIATFEGPLMLGIDVSARLAQGVISPSGVTVELIFNNDSGRVVALSDAPTVDGTVVQQIIRGSELQAPYNYLLVVTFNDGAENIQTCFTSIVVPI